MDVTILYLFLCKAKFITITCYNVVHKSGWHAENANQQVTDGKVENKQVGDSSHVPAAKHNETHHPIPHHAHHEDEQVGHGEDGSHTGFVQVEIHIGDVLVGPKIIMQYWEPGEVQVLRVGMNSWILCHGAI